MYLITKDGDNGEPEIVKTIDGTKEEALAAFDSAIKDQVYHYHVLKDISKWRKLRLWDEDGNCIRQES